MKKRYSPIESKELLKRILIPAKGRKNIGFKTKAGLQIANGYTKLQTSHFGVMIEFTLKQIYMPVLYFSTQDSTLFFTWLSDCSAKVEILQPRHSIEGTSFIPDNFYVNPKDLFIHGRSLLRKEKVCLRNL